MTGSISGVSHVILGGRESIPGGEGIVGEQTSVQGGADSRLKLL